MIGFTHLIRVDGVDSVRLASFTSSVWRVWTMCDWLHSPHPCGGCGQCVIGLTHLICVDGVDNV